MLDPFSYHIRRDENKTTIRLNGNLTGIAFPYIVYYVLASLGVADTVQVYLQGILYGSILWLLTLVPIHKSITGFSR
jgi:hypothetical protein